MTIRTIRRLYCKFNYRLNHNTSETIIPSTTTINTATATTGATINTTTAAKAPSKHTNYTVNIIHNDSLLHNHHLNFNKNNHHDHHDPTNESYINMGHSIDKLRIDLPQFFDRGIIDSSIYSKTILFKDPHHTQFQIEGKQNYLMFCQVVKGICWLWFEDIRFSIVSFQQLDKRNHNHFMGASRTGSGSNMNENSSGSSDGNGEVDIHIQGIERQETERSDISIHKSIKDEIDEDHDHDHEYLRKSKYHPEEYKLQVHWIFEATPRYIHLLKPFNSLSHSSAFLPHPSHHRHPPNYNKDNNNKNQKSSSVHQNSSSKSSTNAHNSSSSVHDPSNRTIIEGTFIYEFNEKGQFKSHILHNIHPVPQFMNSIISFQNGTVGVGI